jgi:hypothetical protein
MIFCFQPLSCIDALLAYLSLIFFSISLFIAIKKESPQEASGRDTAPDAG